MTSETLPTYDWTEPARLQENDWDCSCESTEWMLYSWGRAPDDNWIENSMIAGGVVDPAVGCLDKSGAGLARWLNDEYGEFGYVASNDGSVSFDDVAFEANSRQHPLAMSGGNWYHWTGVRGYDSDNDTILLANPAPGYMGVDQVMSRYDWDRLGPWSMVRLMHPAAEGAAPPESPEIPETPAEPSYAPDGTVGTGILEMMAADNTTPAMPSTFLPLGVSPAVIEWGWGINGTMYAWHLPSGRHWRYRVDD